MNEPTKPTISERTARLIAGAFSQWFNSDNGKNTLTAKISVLQTAGLLEPEYKGKGMSKRLVTVWVLTPIGPISRSDFEDELHGTGEDTSVSAWHYRTDEVVITIFND